MVIPIIPMTFDVPSNREWNPSEIVLKELVHYP